MSDEKEMKIDIPESIEGYRLTLFWGLTIIQIILVFIAILFIGFAVFNGVLRKFALMGMMFVIAGLSLLGILEIRGRNLYRHIMFIVRYYTTKPRVLIYKHYAASGIAVEQAKIRALQKDNNTKTFIFVIGALVIGVTLLVLISIYLYHVLHS
jgi:hypothetical protein